ncbi:MAG: hypothetical protein ACRC2T_18815 [Thermoguttaceae bacterium]
MPVPTPKPETLKDWVTQNKPNVPDTALAALATCYRSAAEGIEKGAFKTQTSAYAALRTATQTKIKPEIWGDFLDNLETQITEKLAGNTDVKTLGKLFEEVAAGLTPTLEDEVGFKQIATPQPGATCPDPTGKACQVPTSYPAQRTIPLLNRR